MATTQTTIHPVEEAGTYTTKRPRNRGFIAGVVAILLLTFGVGYMISDEGPTSVNQAAVGSETLSRDQIMQDLVNRGLVPRQALDTAPQSGEDLLRDLVNRGLVPRQALDTAPQSREELLRDLVNRGLIPRQSLEE